MTETKFENPFREMLTDKTVERTKLNAIVPYSIYATLKAVRPYEGTIQTTINIFLQKLCNELRRLNITAATDRIRFERFVTEFTLCHGEDTAKCNSKNEPHGQPNLVVDATPPGGNVRRRAVKAS